MQLRYVFSELRQGLRRNLTMHVAVVLTLFVSLSLAGVGTLLQREADLTADHLGDQLRIRINLCTVDDLSGSPNCAGGEVTDDQRGQIEEALEETGEVKSFEFVSKEDGYEEARSSGLYPEESFEGPDPVIPVDQWPAAYWVTLEDPDAGDGVVSAVAGLDGVGDVLDTRQELSPIYSIMDALRWGSWIGSAALLLAALLLVANTIRLAAMARRREIAIMRLVGASTLYIALPFLLESLVTAAIGAALASLALAGFMQFAVNDGLAPAIEFLPWIDWSDYVQALIGGFPPGILWLAPALTVIPTLLLTRKYTKV
jgi:cell division transport system permease protein